MTNKKPFNDLTSWSNLILGEKNKSHEPTSEPKKQMKKLIKYIVQAKVVQFYINDEMVCYFNNSTAASLFGVITVFSEGKALTSFYDTKLEKVV